MREMRTILWTRVGNRALLQWPFKSRHMDGADAESGDCDEEDDSVPARAQSANYTFYLEDDDGRLPAGPCVHCNGNAKAHIWHLALECPQEHVASYRTTVLEPAAWAFARNMADMLILAYPRLQASGGEVPAGVPGHIACRRLPAALLQAATALKAALAVPQGADTKNDRQCLLYRLLLCAPISAFDVRLPHSSRVPGPGGSFPPKDRSTAHIVAPAPVRRTDMPATLALGQILDSVVLPNSRLRPWANAWAAWSVRHLFQLAGVHRCTHSGRSAAAAHKRVPCPLCAPQRPFGEQVVPDLLDAPPFYGPAPPPPPAATGGAGAGAGAAAAAVAPALPLPAPSSHTAM